MVSIVNGYVCFNCTDTEKAQKGVDPANPNGDPSKEKNPVKLLKEKQTREAHEGLAANSKRSANTGDASGAGAASSPTGPVAALLPAGVGETVDVTA
jgi:hypothetical protein